MAGFRYSVIFAMSATVALFAGDQPAVKGGVQLRSRINVQPGYESLVTAPPNILDTTTTEYTFGRTISRHAIALQVHVGNSSQQYDLLVHDIGLEICKRDDKPPKRDANQLAEKGSTGTAKPRSQLQRRSDEPFCPEGPVNMMSSLDKFVMQGLADRGQSQDPRNMALRLITGVGAAATPLPTFIGHLGHSFVPGVAAWDGPVAEAYKAIFPDYTVNQLVRLNNSSFESNKIVPKTSSAKVTIFFPIELVLDRGQIREFRRDPYTLFSDAVRDYRVVVDAQFITPVTPTDATKPPTDTTKQ
jgi:hypothetical protein